MLCGFACLKCKYIHDWRQQSIVYKIFPLHVWCAMRAWRACVDIIYFGIGIVLIISHACHRPSWLLFRYGRVTLPRRRRKKWNNSAMEFEWVIRRDENEFHMFSPFGQSIRENEYMLHAYGKRHSRSDHRFVVPKCEIPVSFARTCLYKWADSSSVAHNWHDQIQWKHSQNGWIRCYLIEL